MMPNEPEKPDKTRDDGGAAPVDSQSARKKAVRAERLAAELRANLTRRKAAARGRQSGDRPAYDGPTAGPPDDDAGSDGVA